MFGRDGYVCFEFPTLPQGFLWQALYVSFVASIEALSHIGVGLMGWCPGIYTCVGIICGRVMHGDCGHAYLYSMKGGA